MKPKRRAAFDVESFLLSEGIVNKSREFRPNEVIASQGETVGNVLYYVRKGSVKRSVVSYWGAAISSAWGAFPN
jgi:CRP-like cAMP-binding protein